MTETPDDLKAAYKAEEKAAMKLSAARGKANTLRASLDVQKAKVVEARIPFEATRATRRTLEREYGVGEYADTGIPAQIVEAIPGSAQEE